MDNSSVESGCDDWLVLMTFSSSKSRASFAFHKVFAFSSFTLFTDIERRDGTMVSHDLGMFSKLCKSLPVLLNSTAHVYT